MSVETIRKEYPHPRQSRLWSIDERPHDGYCVLGAAMQYFGHDISFPGPSIASRTLRISMENAMAIIGLNDSGDLAWTMM
jgi:hypothetical protein